VHGAFAVIARKGNESQPWQARAFGAQPPCPGGNSANYPVATAVRWHAGKVCNHMRPRSRIGPGSTAAAVDTLSEPKLYALLSHSANTRF